MDLKSALEILESKQWCSLRLITANVAKGTGGQVLELPKCRQRAGVSDGQHAQFTRNVQLANSQRVITIHPILITHVNNTAVV